MLIRADARRIPLADRCVQCVVTSPPYFRLRDYGTATWEGGDASCDHRKVSDSVRAVATSTLGGGKKTTGHQQEGFLAVCGKCGAQRQDAQIGLEPTPDAYVQELVTVFREVRRVLKDDGVLWLNIGDSYNNADKWGGGGVNTGKHTRSVDGEVPSWSGVRRRWSGMEGTKPKDLLGIPWMVAFALRADGWYLRSDIIWHKPNPMPESVTDRPTKAHEYLFLLSKRQRYYYDSAAIRDAASTLTQFETPYTGQATKDYAVGGVQNPSDIKRRITDKQRGHWRRHAGFNDRWDAMPKDVQQQQGANKRSVWTVATRPYSGAHFATMPEKLVEPCIRAGSRIGDRVFDPFIGSGTVGAVAERLSRRWVGCDLNPEYLSLAITRTYVESPEAKTPLFAQERMF